jgi:hypothetical protein
VDAVLQRHDKDGKVIPTFVGIHCTNETLYILLGMQPCVVTAHLNRIQNSGIEENEK